PVPAPGDDTPGPAPGGRADASARIAYMPGVDGLRAVAVAAMVVFHLGASWLAGGFLGVDVFLVISGFLITSLLLAERRERGRIDLVRFWVRRARRLLPALFVVMAATLAAMVILHPEEVAGLRGATLASLGYVANWYFVFADVPYFEQFGRPSVFLHLWSLAVEEQFYLVWPPVLALGLALATRRVMLALSLVAGAGSVALAWWLFDPFAASDRIYYGTDTRAVGLLAGVVLAFLVPAAGLAPLGPRRRRALDTAGFLAAAALVLLLVGLDESGARLYQGGFALTAAVTAVLVLAAAQPGTRTGRALGWRPLVWVGKRSYGIYLWHWPVIQLTRAGQDVPISGAPLVAVQVAVTVGAAALSYRFVETPVRRHGLAGVRAALRGPGTSRPLLVRRAGLAAGLAGVVALGSAVALAPAGKATLAGFDRRAEAATRPAAGGPGGSPGPVGPLLLVGDSVMLNAGPELRRTFGAGTVIDAAAGRRFPEGAEIVLGHLRRMPAGTRVVVHLGNNYYVRPGDLEGLVRRLPPGRRVYLVTVRVALPWQDSVNRILRAAPARHPGVTLVDWHAASGAPGLLVDGAHTTPRGSRLYARTLRDALRAGSASSDPDPHRGPT
ncbi:MAG TPA: acyltransferase family protein, partial [Miltoncostaeaceae bacterium]|nr:acyltransferase family protein [Miltoncostaeaceae bacterium]